MPVPGLMLSRHPIVTLTPFLLPDVCDAAAVPEGSKSRAGFSVSLKKYADQFTRTARGDVSQGDFKFYMLHRELKGKAYRQAI